MIQTGKPCLNLPYCKKNPIASAVGFFFWSVFSKTAPEMHPRALQKPENP